MFTSEMLWDAWPAQRFVEAPAPCIRHADLAEQLATLETKHSGRLKLEEVGRSFEDRPIWMLTLGSGPRKVLLWSQMHGDEPSATPALLDVADFLLSNADRPATRAILDDVTLLMVPMLNPDGAERYQRRNAQGIDINRDALRLVTPEGRLLRQLRERHEPVMGFNLHDQNRRTAVGDTGALATIAVLAVAGDPEGTVTPGRKRTKRACSAIVSALSPFVPGGISRYDEDWSPRAFGDNLTAWGSPVVLIESGGVPQGWDLSELTRLNFVALLSVLQDLVRNDLADHDPALYEALERNASRKWADVVIRGARLVQPGAAASYVADLGFNLLREDRVVAGCTIDGRVRSEIVELGDARFVGAARDIDAAGKLLLPALTVSVQGVDAGDWLTPEHLDRLARLGVERIRWHVEATQVPAAQDVARRGSGAGRPQMEVVDPASPAAWVALSGPPTPGEVSSLGQALDSLTGERWRETGASRSLGELVADLMGRSGERGAAGDIGVEPGDPASLLLVRPLAEAAADPDRLVLQSIWIDGVSVMP
jgi:hypothetical protein